MKLQPQIAIVLGTVVGISCAISENEEDKRRHQEEIAKAVASAVEPVKKRAMDAENDAKNATRAIDSVKVEVASMKLQVASADLAVANATSLIRDLRATIYQNQKTIAKQEDEIGRLRETNNNKDEIIKKLSDDNEKLRATNNQLQQQINTLQPVTASQGDVGAGFGAVRTKPQDPKKSNP